MQFEIKKKKNSTVVDLLYVWGGGGGGWNAIKYQILDPLKIQISDPPPKKKNHVFAKNLISGLKNLISDQEKNYYQISHPLKNQISDIKDKVPPFHPPPPVCLFKCANHGSSSSFEAFGLCQFVVTSK